MKNLFTFFLALFVASSVWAQVSPNHKYELGDTVWFMNYNRPVFGIICAINTCTYVDFESATKKEEIDYVFDFPEAEIYGGYKLNIIGDGHMDWEWNRFFEKISRDGYVRDYSEIFLSKKELIESLYKKD